MSAWSRLPKASPGSSRPADRKSTSEPVSETTQMPARSRRILGGLLLVPILSVLAAWFPVSRAWHDTRLRESTLPQLEEMVAQTPFDGPTQTLLAIRLAEAKAFRPADAVFERAVGLGESDPQVWLTWAATAAAAGDRMRASAILRIGMQDAARAPKLRSAIEAANALGPTASPQQLAEALCPGGTGPLAERYTAGSFLNGFAAWRGTRNKAESGFATREQMARANPRDAEWQRLWGEALTRNRRLPEAEKALKTALELAPDSPEAHLAMGNLLALGGEMGRAGIEYSTSLRLKPNWSPALQGLGNVAVAKNLIPIGVQVFERLVKQEPKSPDAWIGMGRAYYNQRLHLDKSLAAFQKAERLAPDRTDFYPDYSNALRNNFKLDEAEVILRKRLAVAPEDARAHYLLALLLIDNRASPSRESDAEKALRLSLQYAPEAYATWERLGRLLLERGSPREAIRAVHSALRFDRFNVPALLTLERAYRKLGRTKEAAAIQAQGAELARYKQRAAFLEDQVNREPSNRKTHLELAKLYAARGETEKAKLHSDMAYLLKEHPEKASKGIKALRDQMMIITPPDPR